MTTASNLKGWQIIHLLLIVVLFCSSAYGKIIYVDDDAVGADEGSSWENAYIYLQDALADAEVTEKPVEIRIAQGIYTPDRGKNQITGNRWATFQLINGVTLMGGFAGPGAADPNTRNISLYETILSGDLNGDDGALLNSNIENSYHIVTGNWTDETAVMDGFTIRYGNANRRCYPDFAGGGMILDSGSPTVANCSFIANEGLDAGGMANDNDSNPNLINCTFIGNLSEWGGGMANVHGSSPTLTNCLFIRNHATKDGGGMYNGKEGNVTLINCTFSGNSAGRGGAMQCDYCSSIRLVNTILWNNSPDEIYLRDSFATVTYSDIQGGWPGVGNIDIDPLFADPYNDDFHLKSQAGRWDEFSESWVIDDVTSPCIDTGDPNSSVAFEPFPNGIIINMGAYGNTTKASKSPTGIHPKYGGGTGEPNDPYLIYTAEQMNTIGLHKEDWDKHFKLMVDIDLNAYTNDQFNIIGGNPAFTGVFDGNRHVISNFSYTSTDKDCIGLFGYVLRLSLSRKQVEIKNLGLIDPNINAGTGDYVGSLIGWLDAATITGCYVEGGNVVGDEYVGGLVGAHGHRIPGIDPSVIPTPDYTISYCYSSSRVKGTIYVGGMVGFNIGQITNCYSMGSVFGNDIVGGLVGQDGDWGLDPMWGGKMINCYSTSQVVGQSNTGGLVGLNVWGMIINNCFWDIQTSGWTTSDGGTGKTTEEMQMAGTFLDAGWDFNHETDNGTEDIWWILEGQSYPRLWWQYGQALSPYPQNGAVDVPQPLILSWLSGGSDLYHDVYLGEDKEAVANATIESREIYRGRQVPEMTTYNPGNLGLVKTYYWRIDEVNSVNPDSPLKGDVWCFTTANFIVVDDFENYDSHQNFIWYSWKDGLGYAVGSGGSWPIICNWTGSAVGDETTPSYMEETIVHAGKQSMPYWYDNNKQSYAKYSEAEKTLSYPRDWIEDCVSEMSLWFNGVQNNDPEPMYVAVANRTDTYAVIYHDDLNAVRIDTWTEWIIPFQSFADQGIDLTDVDRIAIGFGTRGNMTTPGGKGKMYFDDIRLYRPRPEQE